MIIAANTLEQPAGHRFRRPPHFPYWTLGFIRTGWSYWDSKTGAEIRSDAPALSLTQPDTPYTVHSPEPHLQTYVIFRPLAEWLRHLQWPELWPGKMSLRVREDVDELFRLADNLVRDWQRRDGFGRALAMNALERIILLTDQQCPKRKATRPDEQIEAALELMQSSLDQHLSVTEIAAELNMSASSFAHRFRELVGESPMVHHERLRLQRARDLLLSTNLQIQEVARRVGFTNPYHFSTRFRLATGQSPRSFRSAPGG